MHRAIWYIVLIEKRGYKVVYVPQTKKLKDIKLQNNHLSSLASRTTKHVLLLIHIDSMTVGSFGNSGVKHLPPTAHPHIPPSLASSVFSPWIPVHPSTYFFFIVSRYSCFYGHTMHALVMSGKTMPQVTVIIPLGACPFPWASTEVNCT